MVSKKRLYRNMSIISFTMVFVLTLNLIIPLFTQAEENDERITMEFSVNTENNTIEVNGKIPSNYNGYELYWANKKYDKEKPQNPNDNAKYLEDTIKWFEDESNKIKSATTVEGNVIIKNSVTYKAGNLYSVLCIAHGPQNIIMMSIANYTSTVPVEKKSEPIKVELNNEDKKISIHAYDDTAKITTIKIKKSDTALKVEDFKEDGIVVNGFNQSNDVKATTSVEDYGVYYIYVENEQGSKCVEPIVIKSSVKAEENDISVELYRITDENYGDLAIKTTSKTGKISGIKYFISDTPIDVKDEQNRNKIKQSGTSMKVDGNKTEEIVKSDSEIKDDKYIVIFVQSTDGSYNYEYWSAPGTIGNLNKVEIAPWENAPITEENKNVEEQKAEEPKKEENKTAEEQKVEEPKIEENKTAEEQKVEEPKIEENKTAEEQKVEEPKKEENKTAEEQKVEELKNAEKEKAEITKNDIEKYLKLQAEVNATAKGINTEKTGNNENKEKAESTEKSKNDNIIDKKEDNNQVTTYVSGNSNKNVLPQTGSNDSWIFVGIIVFSITGICGLVKSRKE